MVGDAIENCFRYLHNFDPEKSSNPFAYFTQIMYYAFLRRIDKEKKQSYIRYKSMENSIVMNTLVEMAPDDQSHFNAFMVTMDMDKLSALSEKYEAKTTVKATKKKGLENFFGDEDESI
jgi:DNA-directed RNA polymerase specialized sigma24 family protein